MEFYKKLMGSVARELPMVDKLIVSNGPKLTLEQKIELNGVYSSRGA